MRLFGRASRTCLLTTAFLMSGVCVASTALADFAPRDGAVVADVRGGGLIVTSWSTTVDNQSYHCTNAHFTVDGVDVWTTRRCGATLLRATMPRRHTYDNGSVLCNTWDGFQGQPCVTVWE